MSILILCSYIFITYVIGNYLSKINYNFLLYNFDINKYDVHDKIQFFICSILSIYIGLISRYYIKLIIKKVKHNLELYYAKERTIYNDKLDPCSICLESYTPNDSISKLKLCVHTYHNKCIDEWFIYSKAFSCPICRIQIKT